MIDTSQDEVVTAALIVIGDEVLSGRTKDKNIGHIAERMTEIGVDLREVRVVADIEAEIAAAVNALRHRYDHVFTTGGIGPTHDDITADSVARAFGVPIDVDERAVAKLLEFIPRDQLNEARLRMARIPEGAELIENELSKAPGFSVGNVHVMAGVPSIMQAMLAALIPRLRTGAKIASRSLPTAVKEGDIAAPLGALQADFPQVSIGSYPTFNAETGHTTTIVLRSRDTAALDEAETRARAILAAL
ncbi:MAG: competence/damage-inducible protein A [Alphaproteobacteria bacterium]